MHLRFRMDPAVGRSTRVMDQKLHVCNNSHVGRPTAIDLFAGAGGLSLGLEAAGTHVQCGFEWEEDACETYSKSHPTADVVQADISQLDFGHWQGVDLVVGGPPCQPWSTGGKRLGTGDLRDGWPTYLRALRQLAPKAFIAENVSGLTQGAQRQQWLYLVKEMTDLGFAVSTRVVNAADYGIPQKRRRCFIVGIRGDSLFSFPSPTHGPGRRWPWKGAGSVLSREPIGEPNHAIVTYAKAPDIRPSAYDGHVYNGGGRPIDLALPAPTLLASMGGNKTPWVDALNVVPEYHAYLANGGEPRSGRVPGARRITAEEAALLQTFPLGTWFAGARSSRYRQIGNAVPPRLAEIMGRSLLRQLDL
jgi:DNA (cytosine-5)-methyltransferase 1